MRILVVSPKFHPVIGGGETFALNSIKYFKAVGMKTAVAVEPHSARNPDGYPFPVYEIEGLSDTKLDVVKASAALYRLIEQLHPDVIHAHGYFALLALSLANHTQIPIVASIHSTPVWGKRIVGGMDDFGAELNFVRSILDAAQPEVLTAANDVYARAAKRIVEGRKTHVKVFPYPIDIHRFHNGNVPTLRSKYNLNPTDCLILTPSRIIERKGIREIIGAIGHLPDNYYLFLPAAADPLDRKFWSSIIEDPSYMRAADRIIIPPRPILYDDMPLLYAASDVIAMPSYYEGAPVATVEAMASGKPFIGADSQGINGFIRHGSNGMLVPPRSIIPLAEGVRRLYEDKPLSLALANQAYQDIQTLSWETRLPQLVEILGSVANCQKKLVGV